VEKEGEKRVKGTSIHLGSTTTTERVGESPKKAERGNTLSEQKNHQRGTRKRRRRKKGGQSWKRRFLPRAGDPPTRSSGGRNIRDKKGGEIAHNGKENITPKKVSIPGKEIK